ncbi:hypothetical protein [Pseudonocardia sp. HH130629-09]|uniref:hypothetical protein n=1 Tax=Pseudonocardia sp. HH130629-09 TaxID=1641402 RepID=UPI0006CB0795|nr:hypothetical protein [Pseudonocardia sp. HH130629-09]ALE82162.1 hypothetical protein XF36_02600 [Pseudonocardia sp. HH130629-09]
MLAGTALLPLESAVTVTAVAGAAVLALVLLVLRWGRWRPAVRAAALPAVVALVVLAVAIATNAWFGFYPTPASLAAGPDRGGLPAPPVQPVTGPGRDTVPTVDGVEVPVHLPPGYDDHLAHPVLVWTGPRDGSAAVDAAVDAAVTAGRMPAVMVLWTDRAAWALAGPPDAPGCALGRALAERADVATAAGPPGGDGCPDPGSGSPDPLDLVVVRTAATQDDPVPGAPLPGPAPASGSVTAAQGNLPADVVAAELDALGARLPGPVARSDAAGGSPPGTGSTGGTRDGL